MLSQAAQPTCRHAIRRGTRALATAVQEPANPTPSHPLAKPNSSNVTRNRMTGSTLYIRPFDGITSMPEAFAVLRAVERRYGKMKHYQFVKVRPANAACSYLTLSFIGRRGI
jgi:hypothetical protein